MKVGDLVKTKNRSRGTVRYNTHRTGIITRILRSEMNDDGPGATIVTVMIGNSVEDFLPRYIEVVNESR